MSTARKLFKYLDLDSEDLAIPIGPESPVKDKARTVRELMLYMFNRTAQMFEYTGLPPTMPKIALERMLQSIGYVIVAVPPSGSKPTGLGLDFDYTELQDVSTWKQLPYAFYGSFGQAPDPYAAPHTAIVANPGFTPSISKEYEINKDCIIWRNDSHMVSLMKMYRRYAWELADALLSLRGALINLREQRIIVTSDDNSYASAQVYLEKLEAGDLAVMMDDNILARSQVYAAEGRANAVIQAIEAVQYIKSTWFNEMGLNAAFNMKRQYVSEQEIDANNDILLPLVDDMLECRKRGVAAVNAMFGLNITVDKNSAWYNKEVDRENTLEDNEEAGDTEQGVDENDSSD